jgi:hypothetical protein
MSEWLRPLKLRESYVDGRFADVNEAERQLYFAVIGGKVRARSKGRVFGPEWLAQLSKMKFSAESAYALPPDIELSVEDAERVWGE